MNLIPAFGIGTFRSFGTDVQIVAPLAKVNVFAGPNNVGKSNILTYVHEQLRNDWSTANQLNQDANPRSDAHRNRDLAEGEIRIAIPIEFDRDSAVAAVRNPSNNLHTQLLDWMSEVFANTQCWLPLMAEPGSERDWRADPSFFAHLNNEFLRSVGSPTPGLAAAVGLPHGSSVSHIVAETILRASKNARPRVPNVPPADLVPAIRSVSAEGAFDLSGTGLVKELQRLERPQLSRLIEDRERFVALERFVGDVLDDSGARLTIDADATELQVELTGRGVFALDNLGTGIHQVVMLAVAATLKSNSIVCIEEPELHLHPTLQRRLLRYLASERTSNQYFITTHAASVIDSELSSVFRVSFGGDQTYVETVSSSVEQAGLCADLGFRASDLVQANCVVWVEGPSDRIYLNHWLRREAPDLADGIHYSLMSYGGRLLAHLSGDVDEAVSDDYVTLRRLNRNAAVIIDSDRSKPGQRISATKQRLKSELGEHPGGHYWITEGREIENYVDPTVFSLAVRAAHPSKGNRYKTPLDKHADRFESLSQPDKVSIARHVVDHSSGDPIPDLLDLQRSIRRLVSWIRQCNDRVPIVVGDVQS